MAKPKTMNEWETAYNDLATAIPGRSFKRNADPVDLHNENIAELNKLTTLRIQRDQAIAAKQAAIAYERIRIAKQAAGLTDADMRLWVRLQDSR